MFGIIKRSIDDGGMWVLDNITKEKFDEVVEHCDKKDYDWAQLYNEEGQPIKKLVTFDK